MKPRAISLLVLALVLCPLYAQGPQSPDGLSGKVRLSSIRFLYSEGDSFATWKEGEEVPTALTNTLSSPACIAQYINLKPGEVLEAAALRRECERVGKRLMRTGWFYEAHCEAIPSRSDPDRAMVVVTVTEGFRKRFGGGLAWFMYGEDNLGGRGDSYRLFLGYNRDGLKARRGNLDASLLYRNDLSPISGDAPDYHEAKAALSIHRRLNADWDTWLGAQGLLGFARPDDPARQEFPSLGQGGWNADVSLKAALEGLCLHPNWGQASFTSAHKLAIGFVVPLQSPSGSTASSSSGFATAQSGFNACLGPVWAACLAAGGWSSSPLPYSERFNLKDDESVSVRTVKSESELSAGAYALVNLELGFSLPLVRFSRIVSLAVNPFLFWDRAYLSDPGLGNGNYRSAGSQGIGLSLALPSPIFVTFKLSYGWDSVFDLGSFAPSGGAFHLSATGAY